MLKKKSLVTFLFGCSLLVACGDDSSTNTNDDLRSSLDLSAGTGDLADMNKVHLTDGEIAQIATSLNTGEVLVAQAAAPKLVRADLMAFAAMMISDHTSANAQLDEVLTQAQIAKTADATSMALDQGAAMIVSQIGTMSDVDTLYIESQVSMHRQALALLDCVLIPDAQNANLKALLMTGLRPHVAAHLDEAIALASTSADGGTTSPLDGGTLDGGTENCANLCVTSSAGGLLSDPVRTAVCAQ